MFSLRPLRLWSGPRTQAWSRGSSRRHPLRSLRLCGSKNDLKVFLIEQIISQEAKFNGNSRNRLERVPT